MPPSQSLAFYCNKIVNLIEQPVCIIKISDGTIEFANPAFCTYIQASPNFSVYSCLLQQNGRNKFLFEHLNTLNELNTHISLPAQDIITNDGTNLIQT